MEILSAKISEFKNRLSEFLGHVRSGEQLIVYDRKTPIARVIPFATDTAKDDFIVRPALEAFVGGDIVGAHIDGSLSDDFDSVRMLSEMRDDRF